MAAIAKHREKSEAGRNVNSAFGRGSLAATIGVNDPVDDLEAIYTRLLQRHSNPQEYESFKENFVHACTDAKCTSSHSLRDIDFSKQNTDFSSASRPEIHHDHAHCEDDHHHHAPEAPKKGTPTFDPHDTNGGDFFHWVSSRDAIAKLLKEQPDLLHGLEHEGIGGLASLKAIAQHMNEAPEVLKPKSTLADNFKHVTRALAVLKPLHQDGHIAPDTQANMKAVLDKNKWSPEARDAFIQELQLYTSKADHINGHNPQVVKAWAIMAGAGGAVCANGCCAGSIFCFNEAMALAGSLYSSVVQALHQPPANTPSSDEKPPLLKPVSAIAPFYRNVKTQKALAQKKASP
jgi:hypothetical protein